MDRHQLRWVTWRRFDPSSSPSASKALILRRESECRQFARHSQRLASALARIPNSERELLAILATNAVSGDFAARYDGASGHHPPFRGPMMQIHCEFSPFW